MILKECKKRFLQTEAPSARTFDSDVVKAVGDPSGQMVAGANAQNAYAITATNSAESLQNNLLGEQTTYTTTVTPFVQAWKEIKGVRRL